MLRYPPLNRDLASQPELRVLPTSLRFQPRSGEKRLLVPINLQSCPFCQKPFHYASKNMPASRDRYKAGGRGPDRLAMRFYGRSAFRRVQRKLIDIERQAK